MTIELSDKQAKPIGDTGTYLVGAAVAIFLVSLINLGSTGVYLANEVFSWDMWVLLLTTLALGILTFLLLAPGVHFRNVFYTEGNDINELLMGVNKLARVLFILGGLLLIKIVLDLLALSGGN